jgi:hypothetical protein
MPKRQKNLEIKSANPGATLVAACGYFGSLWDLAFGISLCRHEY